MSVVAFILALSSLILVVGMGVATRDGGETKSYEPDSMKYYDLQIGNVNSDIRNDAPSSQSELKKKFSAMMSVDEEAGTVTLITEDYLSSLWEGNYRQEEIHSLTTEEVLYIIQDTVNLYFNGGYKKILLPGFNSCSSQLEVARRFPSVKEKEYSTFNELNKDNDERYTEEMKNVYEIILHRISLLSSPKAFIGKEETFARRIVYMASYSEDIDRDYVRFALSGAMSAIPNPDKMPDYFEFSDTSASGDPEICLNSGEEDKITASFVFPMLEIWSKYVGRLTTEHGENGGLLTVNLKTGSFTMSGNAYMSLAITGSFKREDDKLILIPLGETNKTFIFQKTEEGFVSLSEGPMEWFGVGTVFHTVSDTFWELLPDYAPPERDAPAGDIS